jgi:hypothetical protein
MRKKVAIIGASVGGLISAKLLQSKGYNVTIFEKSNSVGGMYSKVDTPFGRFELGMHVLYVNDEQREVLYELYGVDYFLERNGTDVDLGASFFDNQLYMNSIYPNIINTRYATTVLKHLSDEKSTRDIIPYNVVEALKIRFGSEYTIDIAVKILEGLWGTEANLLSEGAIHSFYDLRRVVAVGQEEAIKLKKNKDFDNVIAWPDQTNVIGKIFDNRTALFFKYLDKEPFIVSKIEDNDINLSLNQNIYLKNDEFYSNDLNLNKDYDAMILTAPIHSLIEKDMEEKIDYGKLAIYYFELENSIKDSVPVYYVLGHDENVLFSRMVNYDAYNEDYPKKVISAEVLYSDIEPDVQQVIEGVEKVHPSIKVKNHYKYPNVLKVPLPTVKNHELFQEQILRIKNNLKEKYFKDSGMRTDLGRFFSHDTIREAYNATLEL